MNLYLIIPKITHYFPDFWLTFAWSTLALPTDAGQALLVDEGAVVEQVAAVVLLVVGEPLTAVEK